MPVRGNTVTLKVVFRDQAGTALDPTGDVTLRVLDPNGNELLSTTDVTKTGTGAYEKDYVIPDDHTFVDYEFSATVQGTVELGRKQLVITKRTPA